MPRIAIDYTAALEQGGGIGRYARELVRALATQDHQTDYRLFFAAGFHNAKLPDAPSDNFTWCSSRLSTEWLARLWHRARLPICIERWVGEIDLLHAPDFTLPPVRRGVRTLLTVHDLSFERAPQTAAPGLRAYLGRVVPRSVARADHVLADSEATRQDLIDLYQTAPEKISVLYSGVDARFRPVDDPAAIQAVRSKYDIGESPYLFSVGTVQPRKNYGRLAEALHHLDRPDLKLVIAGGQGWLSDDLYQTIEHLKLGNRVQFIGFADDDDLPALYSGAQAFVYPALYEGFGLPPLEAMACGTPVVTSNVSSLPEVVDNAGLTVDPTSVDDIVEALHSALDNDPLRSQLRRQGLARAKLFTWERAATQLLIHYQELLSQ